MHDVDRVESFWPSDRSRSRDSIAPPSPPLRSPQNWGLGGCSPVTSSANTNHVQSTRIAIQNGASHWAGRGAIALAVVAKSCAQPQSNSAREGHNFHDRVVAQPELDFRVKTIDGMRRYLKSIGRRGIDRCVRSIGERYSRVPSLCHRFQRHPLLFRRSPLGFQDFQNYRAGVFSEN